MHETATVKTGKVPNSEINQIKRYTSGSLIQQIQTLSQDTRGNRKVNFVLAFRLKDNYGCDDFKDATFAGRQQDITLE